MNLEKYILGTLRANKITQKEFAKAVGMSRTTFGNFLSDRNDTTVRFWVLMISELAEITGKPLSVVSGEMTLAYLGREE